MKKLKFYKFIVIKKKLVGIRASRIWFGSANQAGLETGRYIADVRRNLAPYNLPIIPRPQPSKIVDGEHFVIPDPLHLAVGGTSSSQEPGTETPSWKLVSRTSSGTSASTSGHSGSAQPTLGRGKRVSRPESLPLPRKGALSTPRVIKIKKKGTNPRRNAPGAQVEDFVP